MLRSAGYHLYSGSSPTFDSPPNLRDLNCDTSRGSGASEPPAAPLAESTDCQAFSLLCKQVSFLKGAELGRRKHNPEKFPREAQHASHSLRSLCCLPCPQSGVSPRKVSDLRPSPGTQPEKRPSPVQPDISPGPLRLQLRLPKPPHSNSRCAGQRGCTCGWERRCKPGDRKRGGGGGPREAAKGPLHVRFGLPPVPGQLAALGTRASGTR